MEQKSQKETVFVSAEWKNAGEPKAIFSYAEDLLLYLVVLPLMLDITDALHGAASAWAAVVLLLPESFVLTALRHRLRRRAAFFLLLFGITAAAAALFVWMGGWVCTIPAAAAALVSAQKFNAPRERREAALEHVDLREKNYLGFPAILFSAILSFIAYLDGFRRDSGRIMIAAVCIFASVCTLMAIYTHFYGKNCFDFWEKRTGSVETGKKGFGNGFFVLVTVLCCGLAAGIAYLTAVLADAPGADTAFLNFLRNLNNLKPVKRKPVQGKGVGSSANMFDELLKYGNNSTQNHPFLQGIVVVLKIIIICLLAVIFLYIVVRFIAWLIHFFGEKNDEERRSVFFDKPLKSVSRKDRPASETGLHLRGTNRMKIRRMFQVFVRRHRGDAAVSRSDAPVEIVRKVGASAADPQTAAALYEQARYSDMEISSEDTVRMKESLRNGQRGAAPKS